MSVAKFRKRPVEIEAVQWNGNNAKELREFAADCWDSDELHPSDTEVWDDLQEQWIYVNKDDFIVKGVKGEFYPVASDVFRETYEPVS